MKLVVLKDHYKEKYHKKAKSLKKVKIPEYLLEYLGVKSKKLLKIEIFRLA